MKNVKLKFGTDGWRALVAEEFTFPHVRVVAQGIASYLKSHPAPGRPKKVIVGYDTRPLGDKFAETVAEVFAGNGFEVLLTAGAMPTPAISFSIRDLHLCGGVAVTASHNPFTYNGLKFKPYYAGPSELEMTDWIERRLFKEPVKRMPLKEGVAQGKIKLIDLAPKYLAFIRRNVQWPIIRRSKFKIAYDSMHGAGQDLLQRVVKGSRLKIIPVGEGVWPIRSSHRPEPIGEHLVQLSDAVKKQRCDVGLATDGDADRLGLVGPDGKFVSAQETMALLLWHLLEDRRWRGMVVSTISATNLLDTMTAHYKVPFKRTPVGFKHIARCIRTEDVIFGGEESGGFAFRGGVPERDGLLAGLLILEMIAMRKKNLIEILRQMRKEFGHWIFKRDDLTLTRPVKSAELVAWAEKNLRAGDRFGAGMKIREIGTADGVKIRLEDDSWILLRPSGTEPLLRIYAEGRSDAQVAALIREGRRAGLSVLA